MLLLRVCPRVSSALEFWEALGAVGFSVNTLEWLEVPSIDWCDGIERRVSAKPSLKVMTIERIHLYMFMAECSPLATMPDSPRTPFPASSGSIHRLPVEILTEIFLFCLIPKTDPSSTSPSVCSSQAPLLLCHICSSWRQLALETPALWTSLTIEVIPRDTPVVPERHSEAASCWFSRSRNRLIDLEINQHAWIEFEEYPDLYSTNFMIQLVQPQAERIRSLCLSFLDLHDLYCFLQYKDEESLPSQVWSFPNLEYLTLNLHPYYDDIDDGGNYVLTALESIPKLRTVVLNYVTMSNEPNINLPWAQLTCLVMKSVRESLWRILLTQCPALETGCFTFAQRWDTLPTVDITLDHLKSLAIYFPHPSDPSILNGIRFPALRDLSLYIMASEDFFPCKSEPEYTFLQLVPVTKLTLGAQISAHDINNLFRATRNVTTLSIEFRVSYTLDVFTALTLGAGSEEILLPKLDTIHVTSCPSSGSERFPIAALARMAMSRSPSALGALGVTPLREVFLGTTDDPATLRADLSAVLELWSYKTDMPRIRCGRPKRRFRYTFL